MDVTHTCHNEQRACSIEAQADAAVKADAVDDRKRVVVEHTLARIVAIQGTKACYRGRRKNELDLNRAPVIAHLMVASRERFGSLVSERQLSIRYQTNNRILSTTSSSRLRKKAYRRRRWRAGGFGRAFRPPTRSVCRARPARPDRTTSLDRSTAQPRLTAASKQRWVCDGASRAGPERARWATGGRQPEVDEDLLRGVSPKPRLRDHRVALVDHPSEGAELQ